MPALTRRYNLYGRWFEPRITCRFTLRPLREQKFIFEIASSVSFQREQFWNGRSKSCFGHRELEKVLGRHLEKKMRKRISEDFFSLLSFLVFSEWFDLKFCPFEDNCTFSQRSIFDSTKTLSQKFGIWKHFFCASLTWRRNIWSEAISTSGNTWIFVSEFHSFTMAKNVQTFAWVGWSMVTLLSSNWLKGGWFDFQQKWIFVTSSEKTSLSHYCRMTQSVPLMVFYLSSFTFFTLPLPYIILHHNPSTTRVHVLGWSDLLLGHCGSKWRPASIVA